MLSYNVACIINAKQFGKRHHICILANNRCYDSIFILQLISSEINNFKRKFFSYSKWRILERDESHLLHINLHPKS